MANNYNIPQLIVMSQDLNYKPGLSIIINKLLRTRNKKEFQIAKKQALEAIIGYKIPEINEPRDYGSDNPDRFSGLPVFQPLKLKVDDKKIQLDTAVINVNRAKNILTTMVQGRDSSIKELINNGDYTISCNGILSNNNWEWPYDKVASLVDILNEKQNIKVTHEILNLLGVYEVVITDFSLEKTPYINCQPFSFNAISDNPLPLIVEDLPNILNS